MNIFIDGVDYTKEADLIKDRVSELIKPEDKRLTFSSDFLNVDDDLKRAIAFKLTFDDGTFPHRIGYDEETDSFNVEVRQITQ